MSSSLEACDLAGLPALGADVLAGFGRHPRLVATAMALDGVLRRGGLAQVAAARERWSLGEGLPSGAASRAPRRKEAL